MKINTRLTNKFYLVFIIVHFGNSSGGTQTVMNATRL